MLRVGTASEVAYAKPPRADDTLRFGVFWPFARTDFPSQVLETRNPDVTDLDSHIALAQATEAIGLDMLLVPDVYASSTTGQGREYLDPSTHAVLHSVSLILATRRIGIVSTMHTPYFHPVQIARFGGHLAHLSGGRWGWNIVVGRNQTDSGLFGHEESIDRDARYDVADECVELITAIWNTPTGIEHHGTNFQVHGKLRGPFPLEPPVLVSAATSDRGHAFAVEHCDFLFTHARSSQHAVELHSEMVARADRIGRRPPTLAVIATVLVRDEPGAAVDEIEAIIAGIGAEGVATVTADRLERTRSMLTDYPTLVGTAEEVAERLVALHATGVRGVMLRFPFWTPQEVYGLAPVLEILREADVWVAPAERRHSW